MSEEGPKLYSHKPKKGQLKQSQGQQLKGKDFASSYSMGSAQNVPPPPPPPPPAVKESFARRYKFIWPILLTVNLAVGAYVFMRTKKKEVSPTDEQNVSQQTPTAAAVVTAPMSVQTLPEPAIVEPVKLRDPIAEDRQRELYKWMLEEKRKVKPKNPEEKKRIDDEKAVLKQFIRAKSVPTL